MLRAAELEDYELHERFCAGCGKLLSPEEVKENGDVCDACIDTMWQNLLEDD